MNRASSRAELTDIMTIKARCLARSDRSRKTSISCSPTAFRAGCADPVHGLVQPDRAAAGPRSLDRRAGGCSPISICSEAKKTEFQQPARLLHARAERRRAADRRAIPTSWSAPATRIVGACGAIAGTELFQAKGFPYRLAICLAIPTWSSAHRDGRYVTLRLTSSMYHRFHAPHDCRIEQVTYISGDTWNVNPIALQAHRKAVLQERARGVPTAARRPGTRSRWCRSRPSWSPHPLHFLDVPLAPRPAGAERLPLRRAFAQGRRTGLVRARLDHHRVRAEGIHAVPRDHRGRPHSRWRAAHASAALRRGCLLTKSSCNKHSCSRAVSLQEIYTFDILTKNRHAHFTKS